MTRSRSAGKTAPAQSTDSVKSRQLDEMRSRLHHAVLRTNRNVRIATPDASPVVVEQVRDVLLAAELPA
ncbi:hypothetical protein [Burkholderia sp. BCC1999]|uniref:hypothetical protein n=1 Tax=Burkholderia sp. BCC1999 TaxID=2817448 RepID=UPI002AC362A6|nr:hypothetical protein [Burkholderia sp. BCC1999]